jgi:hypothetical protein
LRRVSPGINKDVVWVEVAMVRESEKARQDTGSGGRVATDLDLNPDREKRLRR